RAARWRVGRAARRIALGRALLPGVGEPEQQRRAARGQDTPAVALGYRLTRRYLVDVTFPGRIDTGEARNQDRDEQRAGDLLDHAHAARLARERRDVAESRAREDGHAEVESI